MNITSWLSYAIEMLITASIPTARLDAEILLADELERDRSWLTAHSDDELAPESLKRLDSKLKRRTEHEPLAYIRQKQEFYGREFYVDKSVLVPRPESETIIELYKKLPLPAQTKIADVGCGSGVLGITAALERPGTKITFLDIDEEVFIVTRKNAATQGFTTITCYQGNLLDAHPEKYDVLLCNLPYVPGDYTVNEAARHEPKHALFSGTDGLDHYRELFIQLSSNKFGSPYVITEALPEQHTSLKKIAQSAGYRCSAIKEFAQLFQK